MPASETVDLTAEEPRFFSCSKTEPAMVFALPFVEAVAFIVKKLSYSIIKREVCQGFFVVATGLQGSNAVFPKHPSLWGP